MTSPSGGAGNDRIIGSLGAWDRPTGSLGADIFVFRPLGIRTMAVSGRDTITDFSFGQGDRDRPDGPSMPAAAWRIRPSPSSAANAFPARRASCRPGRSRAAR